MATGDLRPLAQDLEQLWNSGTVSGLGDAELVKRFTGSKGPAAEQAFEALLGRHGPMVLGVCRHILRRPQDVDDAFQATFLVLVRKARSIRVDESLGPWLYGVAYRTAIRARSKVARHHLEEMNDLEATAADPARGAFAWEILPMLHEELNRLPERYRSPIVLCHLEGKTHEETVRALRWPVGTVSGRLSRGRSLLRSRLERRGWKTPEDLIGIVLPACPTLRVPAQLIDHCMRAADDLASPGVAGGAANLLMKGALRSMFWNRMKAGAAALVVVVSLAGTAGMLSRGFLASAIAGDPEGPGLPRTNLPSQRTEQSKGALREPTLELAALESQAGAGAQPGPSSRKRAAEASDELTVENAPPVVVKTVPRSGDTDVDPALHEIQVTFSKEMTDKSWSWSTASKNAFPDVSGDIHYLVWSTDLRLAGEAETRPDLRHLDQLGPVHQLQRSRPPPRRSLPPRLPHQAVTERHAGK